MTLHEKLKTSIIMLLSTQWGPYKAHVITDSYLFNGAEMVLLTGNNRHLKSLSSVFKTSYAHLKGEVSTEAVMFTVTISDSSLRATIWGKVLSVQQKFLYVQSGITTSLAEMMNQGRI